MKKYHFFIIFSCLLPIGVKSQVIKQNAVAPASIAKNNMLSAGLSFSIGSFWRTHTAGVSIDYYRGRQRFGNDTLADKLFQFIVNGGISYYAGKSATTAGFVSRYGGYFTVSAMAGIDYKPAMPVNISLTAGPVLSIYKGNIDVGAGASLFWSYFLSKNIAVGPGIRYLKQSETEALWSGTIRVLYAF